LESEPISRIIHPSDLLLFSTCGKEAGGHRLVQIPSPVRSGLVQPELCAGSPGARGSFTGLRSTRILITLASKRTDND
jgi:hypothetical protein